MKAGLAGWNVALLPPIRSGNRLPVSPPVVTPGTLADCSFGAIYPGATIAATGGTAPYTFAISSGALPTGLTLNSDGTITGTPSGWVAIDTDYVFEVEATDANAQVSAPVSFTLTQIFPTVFQNLVWGIRAGDYNAATGTVVCFNDPTFEFAQAIAGARPGRDDTGPGPKMVYAGSQNVIANATLEPSFNIDNATVLGTISNDANATVFWLGARNPTTNAAGPMINTLAGGSGTWRVFEYRNGTTQIGPTTIPRWGTSTGTIGATYTRNGANNPIGWRGNTSYNGTVTLPNVAWAIGSTVAFQCRLGSADDGSFGCSGNIHNFFMFSVALNATQMQALLEYIQDNPFWGTDGVTLW